jgi:hypothetical protein
VCVGGLAFIGVRLLWFDGLVLYAHALALAGVGADFLSLGHIPVARTYIIRNDTDNHRYHNILSS